MMHSGDHRYAGWRTAIPQFSRNRRVQSAGIDNEPWFGIWYSIIAGEVSPLKSKRPGSVPLEDTTMSEEKKTVAT